MNTEEHRLLVGITFLLLLTLVCVSCEDGNTVAGGNSRLLLSADPSEIGITGTSSLTVQGTEEDGTPLPDGTTVTFSVDQAGRVDPAAVKLVNGIAATTYFATFSSGEITVTATSGSVQARTTITVADNIAENVFVSANPGSFPSGGGTSIISAVVTDDSGRPIPNIGVRFSTTSGTLQSGGSPIETNNSGVATDVLNTTEAATVTATTDNGFSGQTTVLVGVGRVICHMAVNTDTPDVDEVVSFFDTSDNPGNQIVSFHWEFGDGASAEGPNVQHAYHTEGTFEVVHSVIDRQGNTIFCDPFPIEVSE
jgi:hypothetical protein